MKYKIKSKNGENNTNSNFYYILLNFQFKSNLRGTDKSKRKRDKNGTIYI